MTLRNRLLAARAGTAKATADRARQGLLAFVDASGGATETQLHAIADGRAATGIGRLGLQSTRMPDGLDCALGCAFCCILSGADGGLMSETEARGLHAALAPLAGQPDGRAWHPKACPALDPDTRMCRAYDARPMICRSYISTDVGACKSVAEGKAATGPGTLGPYHTYLAALGLSRDALKGVRRVTTFSLARLAAAAVDGQPLDDALATARHKPGELDAELRRSKRDQARVVLP